jgi:hypothetical protein
MEVLLALYSERRSMPVETISTVRPESVHGSFGNASDSVFFFANFFGRLCHQRKRMQTGSELLAQQLVDL